MTGPCLTRPAFGLFADFVAQCETNNRMNSMAVNKTLCYRCKIFLITFCISSMSKRRATRHIRLQ